MTHTKFAVLLSGCGQHDGSETHETILTLLSLDQNNLGYKAFAPNKNQYTVVDHASNLEDKTKTRNALIESSRLVRGNIDDILNLNDFDYRGLIIPGGIGAVTTLCDFYTKGIDFSIDTHVERFIQKFISNNKPVGFICIAPVMIPKLYPNGVKLTIGNNLEIANQIEFMGGKHMECSADNIVADERYKVVSTPANMVANSIKDVYIGIDKMIQKMKEFI